MSLELSNAVACVVPTLNSASTLDLTLGSLLSQRQVQVRVLVADSGSTDGTLEICRKWEIPTHFVPAGNMYSAINAGLGLIQADWLMYINSDDWLYPNSLARLVSHGKDSNADVVYGNCDFSDSMGRFVHSMRAAPPQHLGALFRLGIMGFAQPASLFTSSVFRRLGGFDEEYSYAADADFYLRAVRLGARFAYLTGAPVASFRISASQLSQLHRDVIQGEVRRMSAGLGSPGIWDRFCEVRWRILNIPHYALRVLRGSLIAGRLRTPRALEA